MKPHIAQTVADLRAEAARLADMIATLERYGAETADPPAAPVPPVAEPPTPVAATSTPKVRRRASLAESANGKFKIRNAVRCVCADLAEPFTPPAVIEACRDRWPERAGQIDRGNIPTVLIQLAQAGELKRDASTKPATYIRTAKLGAPDMTDREARFRDFRSTIKVHTTD